MAYLSKIQRTAGTFIQSYTGSNQQIGSNIFENKPLKSNNKGYLIDPMMHLLQYHIQNPKQRPNISKTPADDI